MIQTIETDDADLIQVGAWAIFQGVLPQDSEVLCPVNDGMGYYCQWVAGHYGGCVLGREGRQLHYISEAS